MATSSRSLAFLWGFWLVQPSRRLRTLRTCSGWKRTPKCRSISSATRAAVHSSVRQPWALAPLSSRPSSSPSCSAARRGVGPGWGLAASLSGSSPGELQPGVDGGASARRGSGRPRSGDSPCSTSSTARRRRRSSSSAVPMGLIPSVRPEPTDLFSWPRLESVVARGHAVMAIQIYRMRRSPGSVRGPSWKSRLV